MFPTVHFYCWRDLRFNASTALFPSPPAAAEQWQHGALVWRDPWKSWFKLKGVQATPLQASSLGREVESVQKRSSLGLVLSQTSSAPTQTQSASCVQGGHPKAYAHPARQLDSQDHEITWDHAKRESVCPGFTYYSALWERTVSYSWTWCRCDDGATKTTLAAPHEVSLDATIASGIQ